MTRRLQQPSLNATDPINENIETIARIEKRFLEARSTSDRVADAIAGFSGSMTFVGLHAVGFLIYIIWNLGFIPHLRAFDPYPFMLLSMVVSLEAIFLSTFVLIKENRMSQRADQRASLDLQINLLAEREMTVVLQMLRAIGDKLGVEGAAEKKVMEQLSEHTAIEKRSFQSWEWVRTPVSMPSAWKLTAPR